MQIFLCGLYRSGTTVTWRTIAQDKRLQSFDEPFNEFLAKLPASHPAKFGEEYLQRFQENEAEFKSKFCPILPQRDLKRNLSPAEKEYLSWLVKPHPAVNIDFTRCTFKLTDLRQLFPDALIIHLRRLPQAFASSHIKPSFKAPGIKGVAGRWYREKTFFSRKSRYNFYNYEKIIEEYEPEQFAYLLPQLKDYQGQKLQNLPAYVKMLLLHRHNQNMVDEFSKVHPKNFLEWQFEEFASHPKKHLKQIYDHFNQTMPNFKLDNLRSPNLGYLPDSKKWDVFS